MRRYAVNVLIAHTQEDGAPVVVEDHPTYTDLVGRIEHVSHMGTLVTGSVNQYGQIQAIGAVNEKIEGFFDICQGRGLKGNQGVLIPSSNVKHLMLYKKVVDAVAVGQFHIYAVETIAQCLELLTGLEAGQRDEQGQFPEGTLNQRIAAGLLDYGEKRREFTVRAPAADEP